MILTKNRTMAKINKLSYMYRYSVGKVPKMLAAFPLWIAKQILENASSSVPRLDVADAL